MNSQRLLLVPVALAATIAIAVPALAEPARTTTVGPAGTTFEWTGEPASAIGLPGPLAFQVSECGGPDHPCDDTLVKVEAAGNVSVTLTPNEPTTDVDLHVFRSNASGAESAPVGDSMNLLDVPEELVFKATPGFYLVRSSYYTAFNGTFTGNLKFTPTAPAEAPVTPGAPAAGDAAPTAAFGKVARTAKKGKLRSFKGTASDDKGVAKVEFGLLQVKGKKCRQLTASGKFAPVAKCGEPTAFLAASGTSAWSFKLKKGLPKGKYVAFARAVDSAGQAQKGFPAAAKRKITVK